MAALPNFTDDQLQEILDRLALFAQRRLLRLYWRGMPAARGGAVPGGVEPDDLAAQALIDVIDDKRPWDQAKNPDFFTFLKSIVNSKVSHLAESRENRVTRRTDNAPEVPSNHHAADPANSIEDKEATNKLKEEIIKQLGQDPLAEKLLTCFESDYTKPAEIAELHGIDVSEVNNAQKRLRRATDKALAALRKEKKP